MDRRQALSRILQGACICATGRRAFADSTAPGLNLFADAQEQSAAPIITGLRVTEGGNDKAALFEPILPPMIKPAEQPLVFPTRIGQQVREPVSNTVIECVNDNYGYAHDYPLSSPENADGSLLMLHNYSRDTRDMTRNQDIIVDANTLEVVRDKQFRLGAYRRWSFNDPDVLYCLAYTTGPTNQLIAYHPSNDSEEVLFDFDEAGYTGFKGINATFGQGGGAQDWNDRFMPVSISNNDDVNHMLIFDLFRRRVHSEIDWRQLLKRDAVNVPDSVRGQDIPSVGEAAGFTMSRDGKYAVVFRAGKGTDQFHSMYELYNNDFTNRREVGALDQKGRWVTMHTSHLSTTVDMDGNQVICGENSPGESHFIDMNTLEFTHYPAKGWGHTTASKGLPGYVGSYAYSDVQDNPHFDGTLAMCLSPLRRTSSSATFKPNHHGLPMHEGAPWQEMRQYGYHRSIGSSKYYEQPKMALTTRGDKAYFVSNHSGQGRGYRIFADDKSAQ